MSTLAGHLNAGNYRWLMLLAEFDAMQAYAGVGCASCAHWVSWRCGLSMTAAREKVRVARALQDLPLVSEAMRRRVISYCMVRAIDASRRWLPIPRGDARWRATVSAAGWAGGDHDGDARASGRATGGRRAQR